MSSLMLLDSASLYYRAFFGVPDNFYAPNGTPVNAVRGFLDMIAKLVQTYRPGAVVACWDNDWRPAWRVKLVPSYKTHRVAQERPLVDNIELRPDALGVQEPLISAVLKLFKIAQLGVAGYEADDVIGTLASKSTQAVDVVTGDRDLFQLIDDSVPVRVIYTAKGMSNLEVYDEAAIVAKYGVLPAQYADFSVMRGDTSDGLPGVAGVGEKTAAGLLQRYGDLDAIRFAVKDEDSPLSDSVKSKFSAAAAYLDVAPKVVSVVRDLSFASFDPELRALTAEQVTAAVDFAREWNLGEAMSRAIKAISTGR